MDTSAGAAMQVISEGPRGSGMFADARRPTSTLTPSSLTEERVAAVPRDAPWGDGSGPLTDHLEYVVSHNRSGSGAGVGNAERAMKATPAKGVHRSAGVSSLVIGVREETSGSPTSSFLRENSEGSSGGSAVAKEKTTLCDAIRISYAYTSADVRRRPRNTAIGAIATFILVFFTGLIILGIWKAPYVLLRLSELSAGEMDVVLYGGNSTPLLNFPEMSAKMQRSPAVHGSSPRWMLRAQLQSEDRYLRAMAENRTANSSTVPSTASNIIVVDSQRERAVGIGRAWPYRSIGYGEAQVFHSAAAYVGVRGNMGERVRLTLDAATINALLAGIGGGTNPLQWNVSRPTAPTDPLSFYLYAFFTLNNITEDSVNVFDVAEGSMSATMVDAIESSSGKYPSILGNGVLLDVKQLVRLLVDESCLLGPQTIRPSRNFYFPTLADLLNISTANIQNFDLEKYAMLTIAMLEDRYQMYYAETGTRNRLMTEKTNSLMEAAGLEFDGNIEYPIATAMNTFDSFRILLVSSFIMVVICVVFLGGLLVLTLLRINADERQFELAMIRAQGMPKKQIIGILLAQTLTFAVPGTVLGVVLVFAANAVLEAALQSFTHAPARRTELPATVGVICAAIGIAAPLFATWAPVRAALGGSLRDALDIYRQVQNESKVMMLKLEQMGLATWQVVLGFFLLVAGFVVYYCMPLSFIFENMMLFFVLLEFILIVMVVGICMMLYVAEPFAESGVLFLLLWGGERKLKTLITKNLRSHRERNSKAYMMFLLTVGCLTSAGAMFSVLSTISSQITALTAGAPVTVVASSFAHPLDRADIDAFLSGEGSAHAENWGYSSFDLMSYPQVSSRTSIGNLVGFSSSIGVTAVSRSFMDAVYPEFNIVRDYNDHYEYPRSAFGKRDIVKSMYDHPAVRYGGNGAQQSDEIIATGLPANMPSMNITAKEGYLIPMMMSAAARDQVGMSVDTGAVLSYSYTLSDHTTVSTQFYVQPRALMNRVSGFFAISSLPLLFRSGSILIPETYFAQLLDPTNMDFTSGEVRLRAGAVTEVRYRTLYLYLKKGMAKSQRERLVNALQAHTDTLWHTTVDTQSVLDELQTVQNLIMYFFYFTAVVCVILCAFMLWVTFISNVQLNAWTFGVLRSLGFRNAQLIRGAIYEALCVVVSAFVLGFAAGIIIGVTLAAQFSSYLVLPFRFVLPYPLIIIMAGLAILSAVTAPALPFLSLRKKAIAGVLRGA